jgi:hypothetical protein
MKKVIFLLLGLGLVRNLVIAVEHVSGTLHTMIQDDFQLKSSKVIHVLRSDDEESHIMDFDKFPHLKPSISAAGNRISVRGQRIKRTVDFLFITLKAWV